MEQLPLAIEEILSNVEGLLDEVLDLARLDEDALARHGVLEHGAHAGGAAIGEVPGEPARLLEGADLGAQRVEFFGEHVEALRLSAHLVLLGAEGFPDRREALALADQPFLIFRHIGGNGCIYHKNSGDGMNGYMRGEVYVGGVVCVVVNVRS